MWAMTSPRISISALFASALYLLTMVAATVKPRPATIPSTPMEAALDALRSRFPNQVVIGFEELWMCVRSANHRSTSDQQTQLCNKSLTVFDGKTPSTKPFHVGRVGEKGVHLLPLLESKRKFRI